MKPSSRHSELWLVWPPVASAPVCSSLTEQSSRGGHHPLSCASTTGEATCPAPADYIGICHGSKIGFVSKVTVDLSQQAVDISLSLTYLSVWSCLWHVPWEMEQTENVKSQWQWWQWWRWWGWGSCWWWPPSWSSPCLASLAEQWV